ncbi:MAG TPA: hypothetical protein VF774_26040 [Pseudoduganella sp.]
MAIATTVWKPAKVDVTPERIAALRAPAGFAVTAFATGLKNTRIIAVAPNGDIFRQWTSQHDRHRLTSENG